MINQITRTLATRDEVTIAGGLVIYDIPDADLENAGEDFWTEETQVADQSYPTVQTKYNQFVWIPVETQASLQTVCQIELLKNTM